MSLTGFDLPPPRTWQAFEALCHDLFAREWHVSDCHRCGRNGQRQHGVDIFARVQDGWFAVQCKWVSRSAEITAADIREIAREAQTFRPALTHLVVATTAANDASLQAAAREISEAQSADNLFTLSLACWDDIIARLDVFPAVVQRHYAALARISTATDEIRTQYKSRIDAFVGQYLNGDGDGIPFIGREADLDFLDRWIADRQSPYALLRAPAGRGKSALMANWTASLGASVILIMMPISVRFRTNFAKVVFESLLLRLAPIHGLDPPNINNLDVERARGLVSDLLSRPLPDGLRLLVVLDGIDEAADFEIDADLFPANPPEGLKMICTGRSLPLRSDPLEALTQKHFTLSTLSTPRVTDALMRANVDPKSAVEIARVAQGDPLLVRLYLEGIRSGDLPTTQLRNTPLGLGGYFEVWWADQQKLWGLLAESQVMLLESTLCFLGCAIGPLSKDDLLDYVRTSSSPTLFEFDRVLKSLERWIAGRGRTNDLVLSHPRFADYIREEWMGTTMVAITEAKIIAWGQTHLDALDGSEVGKIPAYLIANFGAHLERGGRQEACFERLSRRSWAEQCYTQDPSMRGFLADVERRTEAARQELAHEENRVCALLAFIDCTLTTATVRSIAKGLPANLYVAALRLGIWSGEAVFDYLITTDGERINATALIELAKAVGPDRSREILTLALAQGGRGKRAELLRRIYPALAETEQVYIVSELLAAAAKSGFDTSQGPPLPNVISLRIARAIAAIADRVSALALMLPWLDEAEKVEVECEIEDLIITRPAEFREGVYYNGALQNLSAARRIRVVESILRGLEDDQQRRAALVEIGYDPAPEMVDLFLDCIAHIEDDWIRAEALRIVARSVVNDRIQAYLDLAQRITPEQARAVALGALARHHAGDWAGDALQICRTVQMHPSSRAPILVDISHHVGDRIRLEIEPLLIGDLNAPTDSRAWDENDPDWLLSDFAFTFVDATPANTVRILAEIAEGEVRARSAANLAVEGPPTVRAQALALLAGVEGQWGVLEAYAHVLAHCAEEERAGILKLAVAFARRQGILAELVSLAVERRWNLGSDIGVDLVQEVLELGSVQDWPDLAHMLITLAPLTSMDGTSDAIRISELIDPSFHKDAVVSAYSGFDQSGSENTARRRAFTSPSFRGESNLTYSRAAFMQAVRYSDHGRINNPTWFDMLVRQPYGEVQEATIELLSWASKQHRGVVLQALSGLAPAIHLLGGQPAADGLVSLLRSNVEAWGDATRSSGVARHG